MSDNIHDGLDTYTALRAHVQQEHADISLYLRNDVLAGRHREAHGEVAACIHDVGICHDSAHQGIGGEADRDWFAAQRWS